MKNLTPEDFFSLEGFSHPSLFSSVEYAWEALDKLSSFFSSLSLGKIEGEISPFAYLVNKESISIGKGSKVESGAYIQGPCLIGENCTIRSGAYIRGDVLVENGCIIGHGTEVKHSILFSKAHAAHFNYVGDSILGRGVNLGAGVKLANLKLKSTPIFVRWNEKKIATGRIKMGSVLGEGVQIGCNTVLDPGTLLGKNVLVYPGCVVRGVILSNTVVKD